MTGRTKKIAASVAAISALAVGGAAVANATSGSTTTATDQTAAASAQPANADQHPANPGGQRSDETLLTGDTAAKVEEAAVAEASGGTVIRVETDADGNAAYEAHITKSDGSVVTVYVDKDFNVVSTDEGYGPGPKGQPPARDAASG